MKRTAIREVEDKLNELDPKEFYRWIIMNMHRLVVVGNKSTQDKSDDVLTRLYSHPRNTGSKY